MTTVASPAGAAPGAGPPDDRVILEHRARVLARPTASGEDGDDHLTVLDFQVGGRAYAVEVRHVRQVVARAEVSSVPWAPPGIAGVTNVRGEIIPVADSARVLGVGETAPRGPLIVLDGAGHHLGLRVDALGDVTRLAAASLAAPAGDAAALAGDLVLGLTASLVVLDAGALYLDHRLTDRPLEGT